MDDTTVQVSQETQAKIARLAEHTNRSPAEVLQEAVEAYEAKMFFVEMDEAYAHLQAAAQVWARYQAEQDEWAALREDYEEGYEEANRPGVYEPES